MGRNYCSVRGCRNKQGNKDKSFFGLPFDDERRNKWLEINGRPDLLAKTVLKPKSYIVCSDHFEGSAIVRKLMLRPDALPSKLVPNPSSIPNSLQESVKCQATQTDTGLEYVNVLTVFHITKTPTKTAEIQTDTVFKLTESASVTGTPRKGTLALELNEIKRQKRQLEQEINEIKKELERWRMLDSIRQLVSLDTADVG